MYRVVDFGKLHRISAVIWDIDGTITDPNGKVNQEVAAKIINLGLKGIYHIFITGRDANWIIRNVVEPMKSFYGFPRMHDNMMFYGEVGCVILTVGARGNVEKMIHPAVQNHPLVVRNIREFLRNLPYHPSENQRYTRDQMIDETTQEVIYDANGEGWIVSRDEKPEFPKHVWSIYKEVFATFENLRTAEGKATYFNQEPWAQKLKRIIEEKGFANEIDVEPVSTALNIVPKVNGVPLGKAWAAGTALVELWKEKLGKAFPLDEVINRTIAFGDGKADFDFTVPYFPSSLGQEPKNIQIVFVGEEEDLTTDERLLQNMIITATGGGDLVFARKKQIIELHPIKGAMVVSAVLDFLNMWNYFVAF